jgi:outer membrane putative beta-barrel porin/alpha-amylase
MFRVEQEMSFVARTRRSFSIREVKKALAIVLVTSHSSLITLFPADPLAKGIQDNSFLVEEAYNQESGVVQHILNLPILFTGHERDISASFTQEWPIFTQTHQFSYTIPYTFLENDESENGLADIRLNYRFQALMETRRTPAFAPRFSFVTPTGDADRGFGHDRFGYEVNLPFSKIVGDRWTIHFNAGGSVFPDVKGHDLWNYNLGASAIYAVAENFNLMLETVAGWNEDVDLAAVAGSAKTALAKKVDRTTMVLLSPGVRYAFNLPGDLQIVAGAAAPIGLTSDSPDWGVFFYLSFEHPFVRTSAKE